jgi:hypothetical protein
VWADAPNSGSKYCATSTAWDTATNAKSGYVGISNVTNGSRWLGASTVTCDILEHLICYVNP